MNDHTKEILQPLKRLKEEAYRIAAEKGFTGMSFAILPEEEDGTPHVQFVVEWDPEKEAVPDLIVLQAAEALKEETEARYREQLEEDARAAAEELRQQVTDQPAKPQEVNLDPSKLRKHGQGFL